MTVAALYVEPDGPYAGMDGVEVGTRRETHGRIPGRIR